jgi:GNAT superfamily N-acetyltransferase
VVFKGVHTNYSAKALEAIHDWVTTTGAFHIGGPFFARSFGDDIGLVVFEVKNWTEGIALSFIKTPPEYRGKGLASRALKELLSFADKHGVPVTGSVDPQKDADPSDKPILNKKQLNQWYGRHGFKTRRGDGIYRAPSNSLVDALLEDEDENIDVKSFVKQNSVIDLSVLNRELRQKLPWLGLVQFYVQINPTSGGAYQDCVLTVIVAKEPVSDNGFDHRNSVQLAEQQAIKGIVSEFINTKAKLNDIEHRIMDGTYKSVCRAVAIVFFFTCDPAIEVRNDPKFYIDVHKVN